MVKTTQKSDLPWSAIFSVIVYWRDGIFQCERLTIATSGSVLYIHVMVITLWYH